MTAIYVCSGTFFLDDGCAGVHGKTRLLLLREGDAAPARTLDAPSDAADALTLAWAIAHDQMTLCPPARDAFPVAALCTPALDALGAKRRWRRHRVGDAHRPPAMPSWLVTAVDVRDLPVLLPVTANRTVTTSRVFASAGFVPPNIPVLAYLAARRRRRCPPRSSPAALKEKRQQQQQQQQQQEEDEDEDDDGVAGAKFGARFPLVSVRATPTTPRQLCSRYALHIEPMWCVEPQEWVDHRRPLQLTLWQVLSYAERLSCALGTLRLDAVLRDAFAHLPTGVRGDPAEELVTEWWPLAGGELPPQDAGSVRLRCRPVPHAPSGASVGFCQVPVCVELLQITAHSFRGGRPSKPGGRLGLVLSPAGNTRFASCSTTCLLPGGDDHPP
ncbi:uncharacterized protein Tco025E_04547 [Trypanosoma conorhini]|uniref:Uncharacterized protein n=1 Tax=Trypanosoma conorhini TaxID=83891 RepID=A0A3R7LPH7_9TRYP|nr:uncharacterized protein Tco025E_04547 [Trypanosoma conorhini]RNF18330.1 hypothetical protein Tco025E_04547 [Trypanosoma conorhini]